MLPSKGSFASMGYEDCRSLRVYGLDGRGAGGEKGCIWWDVLCRYGLGITRDAKVSGPNGGREDARDQPRDESTWSTRT